MSKILVRQWTMLKMIPRQPAKTTSRVLMDQLKSEGFSVNLRTIQRDLMTFSELLPDLVNDSVKDQMGWSWRKDAGLHDIPSIDPATALTFAMAQTFLKPLIPPTVLKMLHPYFISADKTLAELDNRDFGNWFDRVRIVPRTQKLIPAKIDESVLEVIYQSMLDGNQFKGRYQNRNGDDAEYEFHPLGLIFRDSVVYLVATLWNYDDIRHFALHRFIKADLLIEKLNRPDGFNLDEYIASGVTDYTLSDRKEVELVVRFSHGAGNHLEETSLSEDQRIFTTEDKRVEVRATVKDTQQLRWWLLGFGDKLEVIKPIELRKEFLIISQNMNALYKKNQLKQ